LNAFKANVYYLMKSLKRNWVIFILLLLIFMLTALMNELNVEKYDRFVPFLDHCSVLSGILVFFVSCVSISTVSLIWQHKLIYTEVLCTGSRRKTMMILMTEAIFLSLFLYFFSMVIACLRCSKFNDGYFQDFFSLKVLRFIIVRTVAVARYTLFLYAPRFMSKTTTGDLLGLFLPMLIGGGIIWGLCKGTSGMANGLGCYSVAFQSIANTYECERMNMGAVLLVTAIEFIVILIITCRRFERVDLSKDQLKES